MRCRGKGYQNYTSLKYHASSDKKTTYRARSGSLCEQTILTNRSDIFCHNHETFKHCSKARDSKWAYVCIDLLDTPIFIPYCFKHIIINRAKGISEFVTYLLREGYFLLTSPPLFCGGGAIRSSHYNPRSLHSSWRVKWIIVLCCLVVACCSA